MRPRRFRILALVPGLALALWVTVPAMFHLAGTTHAQSDVILNLDVPSAGTTVGIGDRLSIGGWAVDRSGNRSSVDPLTSRPTVEVRAFLDGPPGVGRYIGTAQSGTPRADVARTFGQPEWTNSGFSMVWTPESSHGAHTLYIYAISSAGATATASVAVTVQPRARNCSFIFPCIVARTSDGWDLDYGGPGIFHDRFDEPTMR